jgi:hypothetical protein
MGSGVNRFAAARKRLKRAPWKRRRANDQAGQSAGIPPLHRPSQLTRINPNRENIQKITGLGAIPFCLGPHLLLRLSHDEFMGADFSWPSKTKAVLETPQAERNRKERYGSSIFMT